MKKWILALGIALLATQASAAELDPQTSSKNFYSWYLDALSKDESPIDEHDPVLNQYVTPQLLQKINVLIKSPEGMDDDFFLQDQDYSDAWVGNVSVSRFTINGETASGDVVLGKDPDDRQLLLVTMRKDREGWKIDDVVKEEK
ncbi:DUF3828 domain-containing protein [Erwinia sp. BNK-24-b]|uniref:DUF3828 domain-containing protein n=1 Tax=Erwinia TaxID=551 RepID=UPI001FED52C9|nr:DUF3828 domain-containing protein [Erwinia phyllosphaerae]MBV4368453.1 YbjP/YqhG family protein [Erwinia phyllosphaerae]